MSAEPSKVLLTAQANIVQAETALGSVNPMFKPQVESVMKPLIEAVRGLAVVVGTQVGDNNE